GEQWQGLPPGMVYVDNSSATTDHVRWSPDGERLFVAWESPTAPAEVYELPAGVRWTRASGDPLPGLVDPEEVGYRSFDGLQIPALHYRVDGSPRPTVVFFHGGPAGQSRANFQPAIAVWIAAGYDVLAPNVRGSTGYGRGYYSLDDRELRWDSVRDGCEAGRWLRDQGHATRLVAMGGSYGGFMTLAVLVEEPDLWDAGVDIVGIADWHTFFANTSGWRRANRAAEYGDPAGPDGEFLAEFSPLRRAHRIKAPLLIIHGRNDVRVPVSEAMQIHQAAAGSELLVFDDEGHGIMKHGNRTRAYGRAVEFVGERING
ncbi:MAG TPA: alpha/beta fold hydrolase, partial [Candidatus Eisenbacteria bacterium]|nr:alpha/beta fold hydrolase [Candidatus Eisenbacteria bacterium]